MFTQTGTGAERALLHVRAANGHLISLFFFPKISLSPHAPPNAIIRSFFDAAAPMPISTLCLTHVVRCQTSQMKDNAGAKAPMGFFPHARI